MEKHRLEELIAQNLTTLQIADAIGLSSTGARYWMKRFGLKVNGKVGGHRPRRIPNGQSKCSMCHETKPLVDFYRKRKESDSPTGYCRTCHGIWTKNRFRRFKQECLDYRGNKCEACGYSRCIASLEFHHLDPSQKDFGMSQTKRVTLTDEIKAELDKCVVLCACCHREVHYGFLVYSNGVWETMEDQVGLEPTRSDLHQLRE